MRVLFLFILFFSLNLAAKSSEVADFFDCFYEKYVFCKNIPNENKDTFDLFYFLSKEKLLNIEQVLLNSTSLSDRVDAIELIQEEYLDLVQNLDFEASFISTFELTKKEKRGIKKGYKKFISQIKKKYLY